MSQYFRKIISEKVKYYRLKMGLSREDLSLNLGFDNSYISKLEREKINITVDKLEKIIEFFGVKIKNFFN